MAEAMTAPAAEAKLITVVGESYNLPDVSDISKFTAATCAKFMDELVETNLLAKPIDNFGKLSMVERREALIKLVHDMSNSEAAEAAADAKAGQAVAEAAAVAESPKVVESQTADTGTQEHHLAAGVEPVKVKGKPGPKPGSKKNKDAAATNQPAAASVAHDLDDQIINFASKVEKIKTRAELEAKIRDITEETDFDKFAIGGMIAKAQSTPEWWNQSYPSFRDYVETVLGYKYRVAMHHAEIYVGILKLDRPWSAFGGIGWTKILVLLKVLTKDMQDKTEDGLGFLDWIERAKLLSVEALKSHVANALKPEDEKEEVVNEVKTMAFKLHTDQREVVESALETAMKAVGTEVKAVGLEAIAQAYMGTGLNFAGWHEAMSYARKHTDDPLTFASTVIDALEKMTPELAWPVIELDIRPQAAE